MFFIFLSLSWIEYHKMRVMYDYYDYNKLMWFAKVNVVMFFCLGSFLKVSDQIAVFQVNEFCGPSAMSLSCKFHEY